MKKIDLNQTLNQTVVQSLSLQKRLELQKTWNQRLMDPKVFVPHEIRDDVSDDEAREGNMVFGNFAADYIKTRIKRSARRLTSEQKSLRPIIVAVGFGRSYDCGWLSEALEAGFRVHWIDVSDIACTWATENLTKQWQEMGRQLADMPRFVTISCIDIQSALADPESIGLNLEDVWIVYLCRVVSCMSAAEERIVLEEVGLQALSVQNDLSIRKSVIVINACREDNPHFTACTSRLVSKRRLLKHLSFGAGHPVHITNQEVYTYFPHSKAPKIVRAMTFENPPER